MERPGRKKSKPSGLLIKTRKVTQLKGLILLSTGVTLKVFLVAFKVTIEGVIIYVWITPGLNLLISGLLSAASIDIEIYSLVSVGSIISSIHNLAAA